MQYTTYYNLPKPDKGMLGWDDEINGNLDVIDTNLKSHETTISQIQTDITPYVLQDYTEIKSIGDADQQAAGHNLELAEPGTLSSEVIALWDFGAGGGAVTNDVKGSYPLTAFNSPPKAGGLFAGSEGAVDMNGSTHYFEQATVLDTMPTNGIALDWWFKKDSPTASGYFFIKSNLVNHYFLVYFAGSNLRVNCTAGAGNIETDADVTSWGTKWHYACLNWDSTNGVRWWVDGKPAGQNGSNTTLMSNGSYSDARIGQTGGSAYFDGKIAWMRLRDKVLTNRDAELGYATRYSWASSDIPLATADIQAMTQEDGHSAFPSQYNDDLEVARSSTKLYRYGSIFENPSTKLRLVGRL